MKDKEKAIKAYKKKVVKYLKDVAELYKDVSFEGYTDDNIRDLLCTILKTCAKDVEEDNLSKGLK